MFEIIPVILVAVTVILGVKLFLKLREISATSENEPGDQGNDVNVPPHELRHLRIEQPSSLDDVDDPT